MDDRPEAMYRNGRDPVQWFAPEENLFQRINSEDLDESGRLLPTAFRVPCQSVNRAKFSEPEWVLIPTFEKLGIVAYAVKDVPLRIPVEQQTAKQKASDYVFRVKHVPQDDNYSHSEVQSFREGELDFHPSLRVAKSVSEKFKMKLAARARVIRRPA